MDSRRPTQTAQPPPLSQILQPSKRGSRCPRHPPPEQTFRELHHIQTPWDGKERVRSWVNDIPDPSVVQTKSNSDHVNTPSTTQSRRREVLAEITNSRVSQKSPRSSKRLRPGEAMTPDEKSESGEPCESEESVNRGIRKSARQLRRNTERTTPQLPVIPIAVDKLDGKLS